MSNNFRLVSIQKRQIAKYDTQCIQSDANYCTFYIEIANHKIDDEFCNLGNSHCNKFPMFLLFLFICFFSSLQCIIRKGIETLKFDSHMDG